MADTPVPPTPSLSRCPVCGFENPPAVLYCQDCGAKLTIAPPSYLQPPPPVPTPATTAEAAPLSSSKTSPPKTKPPRILSMNRERPNFAFAFSLLRLAIYAALIALTVLIIRAPANLPPAEAPMDATTVGEIRSGLEKVSQNGSTASAPWSRVNAYLATVLVPTSAGATKFVRAVLMPKPGGFALTTEKRVLGVPIYSTVIYKLVVRAGHLDLQATGAALGCLPLPAEAAPIVQRIGGDLTGALALETSFLKNARMVRLSPDAVAIDFGRPRP